jgi:hypothetical protein
MVCPSDRTLSGLLGVEIASVAPPADLGSRLDPQPAGDADPDPLMPSTDQDLTLFAVEHLRSGMKRTRMGLP